ncbi:MAG: cytochrome c1 [Lysobacter sp.]|nr:MAG: cytochrome c1 [Lysobacter sp.]
MRVLNSLAMLAFGFAIALPSAAAEGGHLQAAGTDIGDPASLQRGAQLFMNYCSGCHSLKYLRYSRMGEDLGLGEDEVMKNLNFSGAKFGETIETAMPPQSNDWFGKQPPDLSLIARVRGSDWVYTYLKSFYLDESRPVGWNNTVFPNVSMPNPLWQLQGLQHAEFGKADAQTGDRPVIGLKVTQPGTLDADGFDRAARDITTFLEYAGEPAALKRQSIGVWVVLFLALLTFLAWLLKQEYWRDVEH